MLLLLVLVEVVIDAAVVVAVVGVSGGGGNFSNTSPYLAAPASHSHIYPQPFRFALRSSPARRPQAPASAPRTFDFQYAGDLDPRALVVCGVGRMASTTQSYRHASCVCRRNIGDSPARRALGALRSIAEAFFVRIGVIQLLQRSEVRASFLQP